MNISARFSKNLPKDSCLSTEFKIDYQSGTIMEVANYSRLNGAREEAKTIICKPTAMFHVWYAAFDTCMAVIGNGNRRKDDTIAALYASLIIAYKTVVNKCYVTNIELLVGDDYSTFRVTFDGIRHYYLRDSSSYTRLYNSIHAFYRETFKNIKEAIQSNSIDNKSVSLTISLMLHQLAANKSYGPLQVINDGHNFYLKPASFAIEPWRSINEFNEYMFSN